MSGGESAAGHNPIWVMARSSIPVPDEHADPILLEDGDDYYMTFSSYDACSGIVICIRAIW